MPATKVVVNIPGEESYNVRIGADGLEGLGKYLTKIEKIARAPRLVVISDSNVAPLYLAKTKESLRSAGFRVSYITVPAG